MTKHNETGALPADSLDAMIRAIVRDEVAKLGRSSGALAAIIYSQKDGERATGCGRAKHIRAWHELVAAGDPEATREGRALLISAAAWARFNASKPGRARLVKETPPPAPTPMSRVDQLLASVGAVRVA